MLTLLHHWRAGQSLPLARVALALVVALGAGAALGLAAVLRPALPIGLELVALLGLAILAWPDLATLVVVFILYSNAAVIAVRFHHVPAVVGGAVPLLLIVPLASYLILRRRAVVITPVLPLILVFLGIQVLGTLFAMDISIALPNLLTFVAEGIGLYFLITNAVRTPEMLRRVVWVLLITGAFLGALSFYQQITRTFDQNYAGFAQMSEAGFSTGSETIHGAVLQRRLAGPIGEENRYAQIMLMLVPLGLFQFWSERSPLARMLAGAATGLTALGMALTFSRGAAVAFLLLLMIMTFMRYIKPKQLAFLGLGAVLVLAAVPQYRSRLTTLTRVSNVVSGEGTGDNSFRSRATESLAALLVFVDHPAVGVGPGLFRYYYPDYAKKVGLRVLAANRQAHSLYFGLAAETGGFGLACFLLIVAATLRGLARTRRELAESHPDVARMASGFLLAITAYLTTGLFLHIAFIRYFWLILALAGAVNYIPMARSRADELAEPNPGLAANAVPNGMAGSGATATEAA